MTRLRVALLVLSAVLAAVRSLHLRTPGGAVPAPQALIQPGVPGPGRVVSSMAMAPDPSRRDASPSALPRRAILYRADRAGQIPTGRVPVVAGIRLPPGHRAFELGAPRGTGALPAWESARTVPNAVGLAERLADAFPRTGLWPVLWSFPDVPSSYMDTATPERAVDRVRLGRVQSELSKRAAKVVGSVDLAPGWTAPPLRRTVNPFALWAQYGSQSDPTDAGPYRLLLIACRRPIDAPAVVGLAFPDADFDPPTISAVMRDWEQRFGAEPVLFGAGYFVLAVDTPPTSDADAQRVAAEMIGLDPSPDPSVSLRRAAAAVQGRGGVTSDSWNASNGFTPRTWGLNFFH